MKGMEPWVWRDEMWVKVGVLTTDMSNLNGRAGVGCRVQSGAAGFVQWDMVMAWARVVTVRMERSPEALRKWRMGDLGVDDEGKEGTSNSAQIRSEKKLAN